MHKRVSTDQRFITNRGGVWGATLTVRSNCNPNSVSTVWINWAIDRLVVTL